MNKKTAINILLKTYEIIILNDLFFNNNINIINAINELNIILIKNNIKEIKDINEIKNLHNEIKINLNNMA